MLTLLSNATFLRFRVITLGGVVGSFYMFTSGCFKMSKQPEEKQPNILFAISDDQSWLNTSINGDIVVKTPAFDSVAKEGVLFTHAFSAAPSSTPSRGAICTGQNIWRLEEGGNLWSTLPTKFPVYPDILEANGYFIGFTGKGWGPGLNEPGGRTRNPAGPEYNNCLYQNVKPNIDYFSNFKEFYRKKPKNKPFCFWFGSQDPHRGYIKGSGLKSGMKLSDVKVPKFLPDHPEVRSDILDYYYEIERFDEDLGKIIDFLKKEGEFDNTMIVVTGDNGMPFPRGKCTLYDFGVREPLAICWPKKVSGGRIVDDFISFTDFAPTFIEAAGLTPIPEMTGKSFFDILTSEKDGKVDSSRNKVFSALERHTFCRLDNLGYPMRSIRTYDYLYIHNYEPERWPSGDPERWWWREVYDEIDGGPTKKYMIDNQNADSVKQLFDLAFGKRPEEELYDLKKDPEQINNVAYDPNYSNIMQELRIQLDSYLKKTGDPRETGKPIMWDCYPQYWKPIIIRTFDGTGFKIKKQNKK
ncbi:MAG: sulfatase [Proteiniphilum sp.]